MLIEIGERKNKQCDDILNICIFLRYSKIFQLEQFSGIQLRFPLKQDVQFMMSYFLLTYFRTENTLP